MVELLVVVAIVAIVGVFGIPMYKEFILKRRITATLTEVVASVRLARSTAMATGRIVGICGTNDNGVSCNGSWFWNRGWMVYIAGDNSFTEVARVLQVYYPHDNGRGTRDYDIYGAVMAGGMIPPPGSEGIILLSTRGFLQGQITENGSQNELFTTVKIGSSALNWEASLGYQTDASSPYLTVRSSRDKAWVPTGPWLTDKDFD